MWEVKCVVSIGGGGPGLEAQLSIRSRLCDLGQMLSFSSQISDPVFSTCRLVVTIALPRGCL